MVVLVLRKKRTCLFRKPINKGVGDGAVGGRYHKEDWRLEVLRLLKCSSTLTYKKMSIETLIWIKRIRISAFYNSVQWSDSESAVRRKTLFG